MKNTMFIDDVDGANNGQTNGIVDPKKDIA